MNCESSKHLLVLLNWGQLSFEDGEAVETHLESCAACTLERQKLQQLDTFLELQSAPVSPDLLGRCRRDLAERLRQEAPRRSVFSPLLWWRSIASAPWLKTGLKPAAALALLTIGFVGGKVLRPSAPQLTATQPAVIQTSTEGAREQDSTSTVSVPVGYEPSRQSASIPETSTPRNDIRMRNLLLAAVNDQDPALRVDSIDLLQHRCGDETVRRALLGALKSDKNSGVRLKALDALRPYAQNPETRAVLAGVLLNDNSPTIRAQAIDLLVQSRGADVASTLQELLRREENPYIRERSVNALRAMKASTGTF